MPAELRKRKEKAIPAKPEDLPPAKKAAKAGPASKRKAAEDASPVATKKQKPVKEEAEVKARPAAHADGAGKVVGGKAEKTSKRETKSAKPKKEKPVEEPIISDNEDEDEEEDEVEEVDDKTQALVSAFESEEDEEDISAPRSKSTFTKGQDVGKIPKTKKPGSRAITQTGSNGAHPGTVYVGRIPHGFYEHEMRQYFSQFGPITRLRLSRNKKTGASKHFAFIEFADATTAEIVSKTMDGYLLFGHILRCKMVPESQIHEGLWKGANRRFKKIPWNKMAGKQLERPLSESKWEGKIGKEQRRRSARAEKLREMGYEYEAPALKSAEAKPKAIEGAEEPKAIEPPAYESENKERQDEVVEKVAEREQPEAAADVAEETKKAKGASKKKGKKAKA